ncbi:hypothetical protein AVEN_72673-1 [Araneus ventricosus]|uniref:Uncharacterized protein n=1 Tax=Araneus ventricosus TaxID=182803 RepID=A0A4Y2IYM2_ARAVE|nr:hypothetical protein AVEN_72673-1 [Araneus ventricosus]
MPRANFIFGIHILPEKNGHDSEKDNIQLDTSLDYACRFILRLHLFLIPPSFLFGISPHHCGRSRFPSSTFNFASSSAHHPLMNSELL